MKILVDLHHEDLYESLLSLADRLDAEMLRPMGMEWYTSGHWQMHSDGPSANQFLGPDTYKNYKGVSLADAQSTRWDLIFVSHPNNIAPWHLAWGTKAPIVFQAGNNWHYMAPLFKRVKHILNSTSTEWPGINHVRYHPDPRVDFDSLPPKKPKTVVSFVHAPSDEATTAFYGLHNHLLDWDFKMYGANAPDGPLTQAEAAAKIAESSFLFHYKPGGDGYGFNIHRAWASNTPVIMDFNHYSDKIAQMCMVEGVSAFDLNVGYGRVAKQMEFYKPGNFDSRAIWERVCNPEYEWDARLKPFFEKVLN